MEAYEFLLHRLELRSRFVWQDFLEARKMFRKALEHDEDYARRALDLGPTEATSLADLADYLRLSGNPGQYDEAAVALRCGIERDTTYVPFHLFLAAT